MVTILKDFTSKVTKKRYYKGGKTSDFNAEYEKNLADKKFVSIISKQTKERKQTIKKK